MLSVFHTTYLYYNTRITTIFDLKLIIRYEFVNSHFKRRRICQDRKRNLFKALSEHMYHIFLNKSFVYFS